MLEKSRCPKRDSNPRHPDLMKGALAVELLRQPQWSESKNSTVHTVILGLIITDNKTNYLSCWETIHSFEKPQNLCLGEV